MNEHKPVPVRVRQVANELRELRLRSGLSGEEVARSLGMSASKLSRLERGHRGLRADDVSALLGLYRVPVPRREELLAKVRDCADQNWWEVRDSRLPADWQNLMRFERQAEAIYNYETMVVPGLLQTAEYMRALVFSTSEELTEEEVSRLVSVRMERQKLLRKRDAPAAEFLIEETVLLRPPGDPAVAYRQLRHLVDSVRHLNVVVRILPLSAGLHPGVDGDFLVLDFADQPGLLYMEQRGVTVFLEQPEHLAAGRKHLRRLRSLALSCEDSVDLIVGIGNELLKTEEEPPDGSPGSLPCSLAQEQPQQAHVAQLR